MPATEREHIPPEVSAALHLEALGHLEEARDVLSAFVKRSGRAHAGAMHLLGILDARLGNPAASLRWFDRYLAAFPGDAVAHANRANVLRDLGRLDEAVRGYDRALAIDRGYAIAHANRAAVLAEAGSIAQALGGFRDAIGLAPDNADAHFNLANLFAGIGDHERAIGAYETAIRLDPLNAQYLNNLGSTLSDAGRHADALARYDAALALQPALVDAHHNRAIALRQLGRIEEAILGLDRVIELDPEFPYAVGRRLYYLNQVCDWRANAADREALEGRCMAGSRIVPPFEALSLLESPEAQLASGRTWCRDVLKASTRAGLRRPRKSPRIRLAYLSSDFREHPIAYLASELFELHDRAGFEVFAVSWSPDDGCRERKRIQSAADRFIDLSGVPDPAAVAELRALEISIAVDLNGYSAGHRCGVLAERVAPVQVQYLGFPGTMGAPYIDYLVADDQLVDEETRPCYSERLLFLPGTFQVNDSRRPHPAAAKGRREVGLPAHAFVFCSFCATHKITPTTFGTWMDILRRVPDAVLWLIDNGERMRANVAREATERGVDGRRILFAGRAPYAEHLARYPLADLCLDTWPFNGGATTSDALWAGVPVLTLRDKAYAGRMGDSILRAAGLPCLIARTPGEYAALALRAASDAQWRLAMRDSLSPPLAGRTLLFDSAGATRHLEAAYRHAWDRACRGLQPADYRAPMDPLPQGTGAGS